jgi:predicted DNA-binding transcriptional regulator YafY
MTDTTHDTLVRRLAMMLIKLNQGESLSPQELAEEFGVNLRTVQRDLNERFAYLPLQKVEGRYRIDPTFLGKLSTRDIERFASLAGVRGMFPSFSDDFLRDIFDSRIQAALLVKGHHYENLAGKEASFKSLERAIVAHRPVSFRYKADKGEKSYVDVEPHKLMNHKGVWYLAGKDAGKLKTFAFTKIDALMISDSVFQPDPAVEATLLEQEGIWFSDHSVEVVLQVARGVAGYFTRRNLLANQTLVKTLQDGGLIISTKAGHANQVMPIVRYWLPHLRIISPHEMQRQLEAELSAYVEGGSSSSKSPRETP